MTNQATTARAERIIRVADALTGLAGRLRREPETALDLVDTVAGIRATRQAVEERHARTGADGLMVLASALAELEAAIAACAVAPPVAHPSRPALRRQRARSERMRASTTRLLQRAAMLLAATSVVLVSQPVAAADVINEPVPVVSANHNVSNSTILNVGVSPNGLTGNISPAAGGAISLTGSGGGGGNAAAARFVCDPVGTCTVTPHTNMDGTPAADTCVPDDANDDTCVAQTAATGPSGQSGPALTINVVTGPFQVAPGFGSPPQAGAYGIVARSTGGYGGNGGDTYVAGDGGDGGDGVDGGTVAVNVSGTVRTSGSDAAGIAAFSTGGDGGNGGDSYGISGDGGSGGKAGFGGQATVNFTDGAVYTTGDRAFGVGAVSQGGNGGRGGGGGGLVFSPGGGNNAGQGGQAKVETGVNTYIETTGALAHGVVVQSTGGGGGGSSGGFGLFYSGGGSGGTGGNGGNADAITRGTIVTRGDNSQGILAQSIGGGGGDGASNAGLVALGASGGPGGTGGTVNVQNFGSVSTYGKMANAIQAQSIGGGGGNGGSSGGAVALGGDGAGTTTGGLVSVENSGFLQTFGTDSAGILAQSIGGGGGNGGHSAGIFSAGGSGGSGADGKAVTIINAGNIETGNDVDGGRNALVINSFGIFAQSVGGGGGNGGGAIAAGLGFSAAFGGSGGSGGKGDAVHIKLDNADPALATGYAITTHGDQSTAIFAQSIGGGGGNGGFAVAAAVGDIAVALGVGGAGGPGGDGGKVDVASKGTLTTYGNSSNGIFAQSIGGGGGNGGGAIAVAVGGYAAAISLGGKGGSGGNADTVDVYSYSDIKTFGDNSSGIVAESVGGGGGNGGFAVSGAIGGLGLSLGIGGSGANGGLGRAVTVTNSGTVATGGDNSTGIFAQSVGGGGGNGGFSVSVALGAGAAGVSLGGSGGGGQAAGKVTVNADGGANTLTIVNYPGDWTLFTGGDNSAGIIAQSIGGGGGNGGFAGSLALGGVGAGGVALGGTGAAGSDGDEVLVTSTHNILTTGASSTGILAQSVGGGGGNGGFAVALSGSGSIGGVGGAAAVALGGSGAGGGHAELVTVDSTGNISTIGDISNGITAQSIGGGGGNGGFAIAGSISAGVGASVSLGGTGGTGSDGGKVILGSDGNIYTHGQQSVGLFAQSVGGGGGNGGFSVAVSGGNYGAVAVSLGGGAGNGGKAETVELTNVGNIFTEGSLSNGIQAQSVGGGGGNGGFSVSLAGGQYAAPSLSFGGSGGLGGTASTVTVNSTGDITTGGAQAYGIIAQSIGGGGGNGGFAASGAITTSGNGLSVAISMGGDGGTGGTGGDANLYSIGDITTTGASAVGLFAQSIGGGGGNGGFSGALTLANNMAFGAAIGGAGGSGNFAGIIDLISTGNVHTEGANAHGIQAQSIGGGGGNGGFALTLSATNKGQSIGVLTGPQGGPGGTGGYAGDVSAESYGTVTTMGALANGIFAQSVGGGGGSGGFAVGASVSIKGSAETNAVGGDGGSGNYAGDVIVVADASGAGSLQGYTVATSGDGSNGILAQSIGGGGGNGGFAVAGGFSANDDAAANSVGGNGGSGNYAGTVDVTNIGKIQTTGANANGILAQSVGGGGGNGGFSLAVAASLKEGDGASDSTGGDAGAGNYANAVTVNSTGDIATFGTMSHAILAQSVGGGGGNAGWSVAGTLSLGGDGETSSVGGNGGSGNYAGKVIVNSNGVLTTAEAGSSAILAQSIGGGGGSGGFAGGLAISDGDAESKIGGGLGGMGSDGGIVEVTTHGSITTLGARAAGIVAQSIGGGGGDGGFAISVSGSKSGGSSSDAVGGAGGDGGIGKAVTVTNYADISTLGVLSHGIIAQSVGGGGGNGGFAVSAGFSLADDSPTSGELTSSATGGGGGIGHDAGIVTVDNFGKITTRAAGTFGILAQSIGGGGGSGGFAGALSISREAEAVSTSVGGSGGSAGDGKLVDVSNSGIITVTGDRSIGILAQSVGGGGGVGGFSLGLSGGQKADTATDTVGGSGGSGGVGGEVIVDNLLGGAIYTSGSLAYGIQAQSIGGGGGNGGFAIGGSLALKGNAESTVGGGAGAGGGNSSKVTVTNAGSVVTTGMTSIGIFAQSIGGGGGAGGFAGALSVADGNSMSQTIGGAGAVGGDGGEVYVNNSGVVHTVMANSIGILAQSVGGGGGNGGFAISGDGSSGDGTSTAVGGNGDGGGMGAKVEVINSGSILTEGALSYGVFAQSVGGGGGNGAFSIAGTLSQDGDGMTSAIGGKGAGGGDGGEVIVTNSGQIVVRGAGSIGVLAQSVGGGGGSGGFSGALRISSGGDLDNTVGGQGGTGGAGGDVTVTHTGTIATLGDNSIGILAQSIGGGGGNSAFSISAQTGSFDSTNLLLGGGGSGAGGGHGVVIVNVSGGQIITKGALSYGVLVQSVGGGGGNAAISVPDPLTVGAGGVALNIGATGAIYGDAANVTFSNSNPTFSDGAGSIGLIAQAIGGGGGSAGITGDVDILNGLISSRLGGTGSGGGKGGALSFTSTGQVSTTGIAAMGVLAQSIGGGGGVSTYGLGIVTGQASGVDLRVGGAAGTDSDAMGLSFPTFSGSVYTTGALSTGVLAQAIGGGGGAANFVAPSGIVLTGGVTLAAGGTGGAGGDGATIALNTGGVISTTGTGAAGLVAQSIGGGGGQVGFVNNGTSQTVSGIALGGASNGSGQAITVTTAGLVDTRGTGAPGIVLQSIGGGGGLITASGVSPGGNVVLGGAATGNGAAVTLTTNGLVQTTGAGSHGVLVQSIGGGGGYALATNRTGGVSSLTTSAGAGGSGNGGVIDVTLNKTVVTTGVGANGLVIQSIGGGGGLVGAGDYGSVLGSSTPFAGTVGGVGTGGAITARVNANVGASGANANGILLQSAGGTGAGNISLTVSSASMVLGGSGNGAGVRILDGATNSIVNHGTIASSAIIDGRAIVTGNGAETVDNDGSLYGNILLGGGVDFLRNRAAGSIYSGTAITLGAGENFLNDGLLSPGGGARVLTTTLTGNYSQSATGTFAIDLDFMHTGAAGEADRLTVSGTAALSGRVVTSVLNKQRVLPGDHVVTIVSGAGGLTHTNLTLVAPVSAIATFSLRYPDAQTTQLGYLIDFSPATGLNRNQTSVGDYFNAVQTAGGSAAMDPVIVALFDIPNTGELVKVYDRLTQEPYVRNVEASYRSSSNFTDRLFSCPAQGGQTMVRNDQVCGWMRADIRSVDSDLTKDFLSSEETATAISGGMEFGFGDGWKIGGAVGYERSTLTSDTDAMKDQSMSHGDRWQGGLVVKKVSGWGDVALAVTGGSGSYDMVRRVDLPGVDITAIGKQDMTFGTVSLRYGKTMELGGGWVRPSIETTGTTVKSDAFNEKGAGPLNLQVEARSQTTWKVKPSVEFGGDVQVGEGLFLRPTISFGVSQRLSGRGAALDAGFEGAPAGVDPFRIRTRSDATTGEVGLSLSLIDERGASMRFGVSGQYGDTTKQESVQIKMVLPF